MLEYNTTFSIDQRKHSHSYIVNGVCYPENNQSVIFVDAHQSMTVNDGGVIPVTIRPGNVHNSTEIENPGEYFQNNIAPPAVIERFKRKLIRRKAREAHEEGFHELLEEIVKTDVHEFIHYFLYTNEIENDCCGEEKHIHLNNLVFDECWLCDFTKHKLNVKISPTAAPIKQFPTLLAVLSSNGT